MRGPGLKASINLPYLGVTHWHSLPAYVFLNSPGLMHTLPSHHYPHTSSCLHPPTGSFSKHSPSPCSPSPSLSLSSTHTPTLTGCCRRDGGWTEENRTSSLRLPGGEFRHVARWEQFSLDVTLSGGLLDSFWGLTVCDVSCWFCFVLGDPQEKVQVPRVYCHRWTVSGSDTHGGKVWNSSLIVLKSLSYTLLDAAK